jgi:hypothetical protein
LEKKKKTFQSSVTVIVELLQLIDVSFSFSPGSRARVSWHRLPLKSHLMTLPKLEFCAVNGARNAFIQFRVWAIFEQQMQSEIFRVHEPYKLHLTLDSFLFFCTLQKLISKTLLDHI